jgi:uncharacterized membrane protein (DUF4010 family)
MTDQFDLFLRLGLALAIGFLVGFERGWKERSEEEGQRTAGLRTFSLIGLMGGVFGLLSKGGDLLLLAAGFVVLGASLAVFMWREGERENDLSATSLIAAMLTFVLGAFAVLGDMAVAAGAGVAAVVLLAAKKPLHGWVARLTWVELRAGLILAAMTFILLPLLPNRTIDPLGILNPYEIWLMTIFIAAISFAGYAAVKMAGAERGLTLAAAAGGLINSTAVTITLARMAPHHAERVRLLAGCVLLAGAVMFIRVLFVVAVLNSPLALMLVPSLGVAALASGACSLWLIRSGRHGGRKGREDLGLSNPFRLSEVLRFSAILTVVMILAGAAARYAGDRGVLVVAGLSGLADVDAITLSAAKKSGNYPAPLAVLTILVAIASNTIAKTVYTWTIGGSRVGWYVAAGAVAAILCGLAAYVLAASLSWIGSLQF